jgi:hypothetical protein
VNRITELCVQNRDWERPCRTGSRKMWDFPSESGVFLFSVHFIDSIWISERQRMRHCALHFLDAPQKLWIIWCFPIEWFLVASKACLVCNLEDFVCFTPNQTREKRILRQFCIIRGMGFKKERWSSWSQHGHSQIIALFLYSTFNGNALAGTLCGFFNEKRN